MSQTFVGVLKLHDHQCIADFLKRLQGNYVFSDVINEMLEELKWGKQDFNVLVIHLSNYFSYLIQNHKRVPRILYTFKNHLKCDQVIPNSYFVESNSKEENSIIQSMLEDPTFKKRKELKNTLQTFINHLELYGYIDLKELYNTIIQERQERRIQKKQKTQAVEETFTQKKMLDLLGINYMHSIQIGDDYYATFKYPDEVEFSIVNFLNCVVKKKISLLPTQIIPQIKVEKVENSPKLLKK